MHFFTLMVSTATSGTKPIIVGWACLVSLAPKSDKSKYHLVYGYRKWGTRARVFSQTLAHGNSKNETRQKETGEEGKMKIVSKEVNRPRKQLGYL